MEVNAWISKKRPKPRINYDLQEVVRVELAQKRWDEHYAALSLLDKIRLALSSGGIVYGKRPD